MKFENSLESHFNRNNTVISRPEIFNQNYMPSTIYERQEAHILFEETAKFIKYHIPTNILLLGAPGTGKTVTVKYLETKINALHTGVMIYYKNCRDATSFDILTSFLATQSAGKSETDVFLKFLESLPNHCLIILDEVDRGKKIEKLLYKISRAKELNTNFKFSISLILISNNLNWDETLDDAVKSSLQLKQILFKKYSSDELTQILKNRINFGFINSNIIADSEIQYLAKKVAERYSGDSRIAISILFYVGEKAEKNSIQKIEQVDIDNAFDPVVTEIEKEKVSRLSNQQFLILYSSYMTKEKDTKNIFKHYQKVSKQFKIKGAQFTMFFYRLKYLENQGLISRDIPAIKEGGRVRETRIELKVHDDILQQEFERRQIKMQK